MGNSSNVELHVLALCATKYRAKGPNSGIAMYDSLPLPAISPRHVMPYKELHG